MDPDLTPEAIRACVLSHLNEAVDIDPVAICAILETRVPCAPAMVDHPSVVVAESNEAPLLGALGLLNGVLMPLVGGERLAAVYTDDGILLRFEFRAVA
jgi:hypothetical protein